ncbi:MAG: efflux RND transporter periplasmic adaptor subunit [Desulfobacterales bacterium]|nr:efflux RND transporter periplasmic adaptor subunit [Desulfobacterales bacterium]
MKRKLRIVLLVVVVAGVLAGAVSLVIQKKKELEQVPEYGRKPMPVTVVKAEKGDLHRKKDYLGVVRPALKSGISTKVSAKVEAVHVDEGDWVNSGEILVELDSEELRYRLDSIQARIREAGADLSGNKATVRALESSYRYWESEKERNQNLLEKNAVSASEAERVAEKAAEVRGKLTAAKKKTTAIKERISSLRSQKKELRARLDYYTITSQYNGVVSERLVDPGDMASPSKLLLKVEDREILKLSFDIPQADFPDVSRGQEVVFSVQGQDKRARLSLVHPSLNRARMKKAEVWLEGKDRKGLTPGAYFPVSVIVEKLRDVTLVPRSSLIPSPGGEKHVFAVDKGRLQAKPIEVLGMSGDKVAVKGVSPGARVVRSTFLGWNRLSSGEKVEVIQ